MQQPLSNTTTLLLLALMCSLATCHQHPGDPTNASTIPLASATAKSARNEYNHHHSHGFDGHHYPHHFGGHHLGHHYKDYEHYLLPVIMVLGLGVLVMPMLSVLMTSLVGNVPVTTLVSGRRKREAIKEAPFGLDDVFRKLGRAVEAFKHMEKQA